MPISRAPSLHGNDDAEGLRRRDTFFPWPPIFQNDGVASGRYRHESERLMPRRPRHLMRSGTKRRCAKLFEDCAVVLCDLPSISCARIGFERDDEWRALFDGAGLSVL